jgi:uncharacterized protein (DUF2147 family)
MKRIYCLFILMALSSSAYADNSVSFVVGGHRIHIDAPRNCNSASCVSISIPGIYEKRGKSEPEADAVADAAPAKPPAAAPQPAPAPAPQQVSSSPVAAPAAKPVAVEPPVIKPSAESVVSAPPPPPPPANVAPATPPRLEVAARPAPVAAPVKPPSLISTLAAAMPPAADAAPKLLDISQDADDEVPLGDWQTQGKKEPVRIVTCGGALCGYVLDLSSNTTGEPVLINMKPRATSDKAASGKVRSEWSGNIYSRDTGDAYYATLAIRGANSLRVEACAFGRFLCSGNVWTRIVAKPDKLLSSGQAPSAPPS